MSRLLYKYMPLRAGFFETPMIRATPANLLNDPFEGIFTETQVRDANKNQKEYYRNNGITPYESDDHIIKDLTWTIQGEFNDMGILSFTEDYNNPLMWAHYADEHRGVVIEFDFKQPFFMDSTRNVNGRKSRFGENHLADFFEFPEKVDYRREFPCFERPELSAPESMKEYHWKKFNRTILYTKSNDWIYEKEQRSIVQLKHADSIICDDDPNIRNLCFNNPEIDLKHLDGNKIQITYPSEYEMHENMGDESVKDEIYRLSAISKAAPIHLFRINPKAISAVYFGLKSIHNAALQEINKNRALTHLKTFKMELSDSSYSLNPTKINSAT